MTGLLALPFEARLVAAALAHGGGRVYDSGRPASDRRTTDCSRLGWSVVADLYDWTPAEELQRGTADWHRYRIFTIQTDEQWGPIVATVAAGVAREVDSPVPGCWHIVQGWGPGHTFFWYEPASVLGAIGVQVQANRGVGAFVEADKTWAEQAASYSAGVRLAVLEAV